MKSWNLPTNPYMINATLIPVLIIEAAFYRHIRILFACFH